MTKGDAIEVLTFFGTYLELYVSVIVDICGAEAFGLFSMFVL